MEVGRLHRRPVRRTRPTRGRLGGPGEPVFDDDAVSLTMLPMNVQSMIPRRALLVACPALAVALAGLCSCESDGDSQPTPHYFRGATETVHGAGIMEVRSATADVMTENEFRLASPFGNVMTFEKDGTRHDELMYGSYGSRPMRQRVTITISVGDDPEAITLHAEGQVVRESGNMSGEETGYLFAGGKLRYGKYLDLIRNRVKEQMRERASF
jgi:hypothetical protein